MNNNVLTWLGLFRGLSGVTAAAVQRQQKQGQKVQERGQIRSQTPGKM